MKTAYKEPEIKITEFVSENIMTTSVPDPDSNTANYVLRSKMKKSGVDEGNFFDLTW